MARIAKERAKNIPQTNNKRLRFLSPLAIAFHAHRGAVAEWLRSGLQIRLHRFDSGPRLQELGSFERNF